MLFLGVQAVGRVFGGGGVYHITGLSCCIYGIKFIVLYFVPPNLSQLALVFSDTSLDFIVL